MPVDAREAWVRAYIEDVFNGQNVKSLDKYFTENLVSHWLGDPQLARAPSLGTSNGELLSRLS